MSRLTSATAPGRARWAWPVAALLSLVVAAAVLTWFMRGVEAIDDPHVIAQVGVGEAADLGPASLRLDSFRAVTSLPDRYGKPGETVEAPEGTRFVEAKVTQTFRELPDEEYYCTNVAVDDEGRLFDDQGAGGVGAEGDTPLCSVDAKEARTLKVGDSRALTFRYVVPAGVPVTGVRIDLPGSGTAVMLVPAAPL